MVKHADTAAFANVLAAHDGPALAVTDSVFSVDGDAAPLAGLADVCRQAGSGLVVDDAHGFGVLGSGGRGAVAAAGLSGSPHLVTTVTLSKALGSQGGAVLGPARVIRQAQALAARLASARPGDQPPRRRSGLWCAPPRPYEAVAWAERCRADGVEVACFRPPSVPDGISRLRLAARADLSAAEIDRATSVIERTAPRHARLNTAA